MITWRIPFRCGLVAVFVDELGLGQLGFEGVIPAETARPAYHPAVLVKICIYCYLNCIQSSRRLEREAQCNFKLMWLTGRLTPDIKTIANLRKDNGPAVDRIAGSSWCCASNSVCSPKRWWPSRATSSRRSTIATATSPVPNCNDGWRKSNPVSTAT